MTSLVPVRPPSSASNRSTTPSTQPNSVFRHQHSLSSSTPVHQHFGALSPHYGGARSAGGPRQSLDNSKQIGPNGPISPRLPTSSASVRPSSEMLGVGNQQAFAEAIDKWFEDLQSYEATLEEMAAASLDVNFKEELSAIEQWFRVLTASMEQQMEAKLAQLSHKSPASPVVRQFARQSLGHNINNSTSSNEPYLSPNSALLNDSSGSNGGANDAATLLANQRAKLKANAANRVSAPGHLLGDHSLKSPKWSNFSGTVEEEGNSRSTSPRPKSTGSDLNLSQQSASQAAFNRAAAASNGSVQESQLSPILGGSWASQVNTPLVPMFANKDEAGKSHVEGTSQVTTEAANRLAQWGAAHQAGQNNLGASQPLPALSPSTPVDGPPSGIQLDDARKFRRGSRATPSAGTIAGFSGVLNSMGSSTSSQTSTNHASQQPGPASNAPNVNSQSAGPQVLPNRSGQNNNVNSNRPNFHASANASLPSPMSVQSLLGAQQAAMNSQQNWRNGIPSPNVNVPANDPNMVNNLAIMGALAGMNGGAMNTNNIANLAAMANITDPAAIQNIANLLNMRQQMQQVHSLQALQQQLQQNGMLNGMMCGAPMLSPVSGRIGMNFAGFPMMQPGGAIVGGQHKRAQGGRSPVGKPSHTPGSGSNPDEELDMKLLSDIPSWLRGLRLHKYTPNFEGCTWQEMVLMSDSDLESRGVAAVGARRKMLRTFETVRIKKGMALPGDGEKQDFSSSATNTTTTTTHPPGNEDQTNGSNTTTTNLTPTPESDKDANKA
ncbi:protein VTS1 [Phakopsora pachyrhizi]|uniref:RNA-binding protein VTS1 n=1 Tax=Phakopsora pachyrhizi TaxID=170000 RepID=A0AAV0ASN6_PHAPC|nr:protein VTS1 [Phakopsora pachyrhizi]